MDASDMIRIGRVVKEARRSTSDSRDLGQKVAYELSLHGYRIERIPLKDVIEKKPPFDKPLCP
jgi:hypothetical protein